MLISREKLSFIIPTLNEEKHIKGVIESIKKNVDGKYGYEIIVIDNGSRDSTVAIAASTEVRLYSKPGVTISALRNYGVSEMLGDLIIFIDGDVYLRDSWGERMKIVIENLQKDPLIMTGSIYGIAERPTWIEEYWFKPILERRERNYLNGGHLIMRKALFEATGGFNEQLETAEDYDLCLRAKKLGAKIVNDPALQVVHEGYPKTIEHFFRRERWHGRGDFRSFSNFFKSKAALLSLAQLSLLCVCLIGAVYSRQWHMMLIYMAFITTLCISAALFRYKKISYGLLFATLLYGVYFIARSMSFADVITGKFEKKNN